jgi:hypothetical protein
MRAKQDWQAFYEAKAMHDLVRITITSPLSAHNIARTLSLNG